MESDFFQLDLDGKTHGYKYAASYNPFPNNQCNFSCTYCDTRKRKPCGERLDSNMIIDFWDDMFNRYGKFRMTLGGAEPTQDLDLISEISKKHHVLIVTNLSFDKNEFADKIPIDNVLIASSYHHTQIDPDEFIYKLSFLKEKGYHMNLASMVDYPGYRDAIDVMKLRIEEVGIKPWIHTLKGSIKEKVEYIPDKDAVIVDTSVNPKSKCMAGHRYISVDACGNVYKCYRHDKMGNVKDGIELYEEPMPCGISSCACLSMKKNLYLED